MAPCSNNGYAVLSVSYKGIFFFHKSQFAITGSIRNTLAEGVSVVPFVIGPGLIPGIAYLVIDHEDKDDNSDSN